MDVLIQISENYYVMSRKLAADIPSGRASLAAIRTAVGLETVSRLYRLTDPQSDADSFLALDAYLKDPSIRRQLYAAFNYDGRKTPKEFDERIIELLQFIQDIVDSPELKRVRIFRQRYAGHLIQQPRDLKRYGPDADVHQFSSSEIRKITDGLCNVVDKLLYVYHRSEFAFRDIAALVAEDAESLWRCAGNE